MANIKLLGKSFCLEVTMNSKVKGLQNWHQSKVKTNR